jgi:hypothetical protein
MGCRCYSAATWGNLNNLKYAHENGCERDQNTCEIAASMGFVECLKYAVENGCPWVPEICENLIHLWQKEITNSGMQNILAIGL